MDGTLAEQVSLVGYGNLFLAGNVEATAHELKDSNSAFKHVCELLFTRCQVDREGAGQSALSAAKARLSGLIDETSKLLNLVRYGPVGSAMKSMEFDEDSIPREDIVARSASEWFAYLRANRVQRLRVVRCLRMDGIPPHIAVAFAGGGGTAIETSGDKTVHWAPTMRLRGPAIPQCRAWVSIYQGRVSPAPLAQVPDLPGTTHALEKTVGDAADLARRASLQPWPDWFDKSLEILRGKDAPIPYHPDLLPPAGYSPEARRLMAAAAQAWVFGGMGTWNDVIPQDPGLKTDYDRVTPALFEAVIHAIIDAANSFSC